MIEVNWKQVVALTVVCLCVWMLGEIGSLFFGKWGALLSVAGLVAAFSGAGVCWLMERVREGAGAGRGGA